MVYTAQFLVCLAWRGGDYGEVGVWTLDFRSSLLFAGSVAWSKALRHVHKNGDMSTCLQGWL